MDAYRPLLSYGYYAAPAAEETEETLEQPRSKKSWFHNAPLDEVRGTLAYTLPLLSRKMTAQQIETLRREGVAQDREGVVTANHWAALAYLDRKTGQRLEFTPRLTGSDPARSYLDKFDKKVPEKASGYYYMMIPERDVPRDALARMRRAYERSCQQLRLGPGERPDMAIVSESRVKAPGCIHESDHRVRGFCYRDQGKGIAVVLDQEPHCQMQAVAHELFHWAVYVDGITLSDEEERAQAFGKRLVSSLAY